MPTYYVRVRHLDAADATLMFGGLLLLAGFAGTLIGGFVGDRLARTRPDAHFLVSAVGLVASGPFTLLAIMHPSPAIFWPSMFVTLLLLFVNTGPLNAAMANVLPAELRGRGVAVNTFSIHVLGDAFSPLVVGAVSDRIGLQLPVLVTGLLLVIAGLVLLAGRPALRRDLARRRRDVMSDLDREIDVAARIAREAGELVRGYHGKQLTISAKAGDEPVTDADIAANALIVARLAEAFPDDVILSEEIPDTARTPRAAARLDGRSDRRHARLHRRRLRLRRHDRPGDRRPARPWARSPTPSPASVYMGAAGVGAWVEATPGDRVPIHTSLTASPPDIRLVASKSHRTARVDAVKQALQITDEINVGSIGLKIGLVSEGTRDLYFYGGGRTKIWDTCGPEAILLGAGGRLTDVDGAPLVYDRPDLYNRRGLVASNGPLHDFVITTVAPLVGTY